jgi:outer membrane protein insertion porin family
MANFSMDGRNYTVEGYPNNSLTPVNAVGDQIGATVYNKFSLEMRYPITLKASDIRISV